MVIQRSRPGALGAAMVLALAITLVRGSAGEARAFSGFYAASDGVPEAAPHHGPRPNGGPLLQPASVVVLMREGTRTVVSIESSYLGPAESFAMVIPVPAAIKKEDVKTLSHSLFDHVLELGAPRLVESWERDPCVVAAERADAGALADAGRDGAGARGRRRARAPSLAIDDSALVPRETRVETAFQVGEYDVTILSAADGQDLAGWLRANHFVVPDGAEALLAPYVQARSLFLVARVNPAKLTFTRGQPGGARLAALSPLRFYFDSERFDFPIRPALLNSDGPQDLIVNVLARSTRYEIEGRGNFAAPTNLTLGDAARAELSSVYVTLFDRLLEAHPGAAVIEYARSATSCDAACPVPPLSARELLALGADVLPAAPGERERATFGSGFVLSRLHMRYAREDAAADLTFAPALPISGGAPDSAVQSRRTAPPTYNDFQTRYVVKRTWSGEVACEGPIRDVWSAVPPGASRASRPRAAMNLAFAPRGDIDLASVVHGDVPELGLIAASPAAASAGDPSMAARAAPASAAADESTKGKGCAACAVAREERSEGGILVTLLAAFAAGARRRRLVRE